MLRDDAPRARPAPAPYYRDELVTIYHADSADLGFLPADSVQLVVTSPPYNLGKDYGTARDDATYQAYLAWCRTWCGELLRVLEPGGRLCLNLPLDINVSFEAGRRRSAKQPVLADLTSLLVRELGFVYNTTILWLEGNISKRTAWGSWLSAADPWVNTAAEAILVVSKGTRRRPARGRTSDIARDDFLDWTLGLWRFPGQNPREHGHPAPFPEELPRRLIQLYSFREDTVLDPFLGSGTTCCVAKRLGRRAIGVEIDPRYCAVAARRCRQLAAPNTAPRASE
ncbi:MAG TPA: site-specific DNA-methyltransferase [Chloroflexota bacterium]|jgi:site-specific DNA-methyltransferase (adenine-specific)|nr:site-specific DNA-methyltransferase [Chloroflexota bacterium]